MNKATPFVLAIVVLCGCSVLQHDTQSKAATASIVFRVTKAKEHLGHDTEAVTHIHRFWYDGCMGILVDSKEKFVIWWMNNEIQSTPYRFEDGKTYSIQFKGDLEAGVMGYEGKCLRVTKIIGMKEMGA